MMQTFSTVPGTSRKAFQYILLVLAISHAGFTFAASTNQQTVSFSDAWVTAQSNSNITGSHGV
jgi:hypothetical protein